MAKTLKAAIEANDEPAVRAALKTVKDVSRKLPGADKPLLYASKIGADRVLRALLEAGARRGWKPQTWGGVGLL